MRKKRVRNKNNKNPCRQRKHAKKYTYKADGNYIISKLVKRHQESYLRNKRITQIIILKNSKIFEVMDLKERNTRAHKYNK